MSLSTRPRHHFVAKGILVICVLGAAVACGNGADRIVTSADGVAVHHEVIGRGEPTLVLVHGWTNNRAFWQPHTASLAQSNRVVALDLPGFGASGTNRNSWTMEQFGQDVVAVIRALGAERVVVVGFSMGGAAVLEAARLVPERIAGVVLVDIFQDPDAKYSESFIEEFVIRNRSSWHDPSFVRASAFSPETPDSLIRRYIESTPASPPQYWWEAIRGFFRWADTKLIPIVSGLSLPVVAINAARPPTNSAAWQKYVPSFKVQTMSGLGHLGVIWEKTDEFDRLLLNFTETFRP